MALPSSRQPLPNGLVPLSLLVGLTAMLASPSQAFVLHLPAAGLPTGRGGNSHEWVYDSSQRGSSTSSSASRGVATGVSGEVWALRGRGGQRASTVPSMTASSHSHNHQSSSSAPIISAAAGGAAPPSAKLATTAPAPRKRRRRPMIGAAVWAEFKKEQMGVTRALHGLPAEDTPNAAIDTAVPSEGEGAPQQRWSAPRPTLGTFMAEARSRSPDMEAR
eukprot:jgi/Undpi1/13745/HiC_scaffold_9.g03398.m1